MIQIYYFFWSSNINYNTEQIIDASSTNIISNLTKQIHSLQTQNKNLKSKLESTHQHQNPPEPSSPPSLPSIPIKDPNSLNIIIVGCANYCFSAKMLILSIMLFGAPSNTSNPSTNCHIHLITDSQDCSLTAQNPSMLYITNQLINLNWLKLTIHQHEDLIFTSTKTVKHKNITQDFREMEDIFHKCSAIRLFLPNIEQFASMQYIFYMDTDILCFKDIDEISAEWTALDQYGIYMAMTTNDANTKTKEGWYVHFHYPTNDYFGGNGLNSGVMFYNLDKVRDSDFLTEIINIYHWRDNLNENKFYYKHSPKWHLGDQDLLNYYFANHMNADKLRILPCDWNVRLWRHCGLELMENNWIMHGRSQAFVKGQFNDTYELMQEVYKVHNLANITQRNWMREMLMEEFRDRWRQYRDSERREHLRIIREYRLRLHDKQKLVL